MKEIDIIKRIKSIIMLVMVIHSCVFTAPMSVIANQNIYVAYDNYENYNSKIEEEILNSTGLVDENVEEKLNERGVFDDEIEVMDESILEDIDEDTPLFVQTEYYEVQDCKEMSGKPICEEELKRLSLDEVDEIIGEIEDEKIEESEEDASLGDEILETLGIKPMDVYAKTVSNSSAYLKKTLVLSNTKLDDGKQYIKVSYTNYWIKAPEYRNIDMVILDFEGAFYDAASKGNTCHAKRAYKKEEYRYYYGSKLKTNYRINTYSENINYTVRQGYIAAQVDLKDDINSSYTNPITGLREYSDIVKYTNETVGINLYLKRDSKFDGATFYGIYEHFKSRTNIAEIVINAINRNVCSLVYSTATGKNVSTYCTYAGKEFECKYYPYEYK